MRRTIVILLTASSLALAGCSREGDETAVATGATAATAAPGDTLTSPATGSDASTSATTTPAEPMMPVITPAECEDEPDPADHPLGDAPVVLRPCTIPTALAVHVIHDGVGRPASNGDTLIVDYTGIRSETGELFDTSYLRGVPLDFPLGRGGVILGWDVGLLGSTAGAVVKLDIPSDMAYGDAPPSDDIQPGDALTFLVEVRAVVAPVTGADAPLDLVVDPSVGAAGVNVVDVRVGDGAVVEPYATAVVHLLLVRGDNLKVLLNTWENSDPLQIPMIENQSLPGLITGLQGARVGSTRVITMPADLAFGPDGEPGLGLPAGVDLMVVAEIVGVY